MFLVSKDTPFYYLTSVTNARLPVFRTSKIKELACQALNEAQKSGGFSILAYVLMPDHLHTVTSSERKASEVLRFINGIISRRVIDFLKENNFQISLDKLRIADKKREYRYSLWEHHNNAFLITSEPMLMEKVNYIHLNPVKADLVERAEEYFASSARIWRRCPLENEFVEIDLNKIQWRKA